MSPRNVLRKWNCAWKTRLRCVHFLIRRAVPWRRGFDGEAAEAAQKKRSVLLVNSADRLAGRAVCSRAGSLFG
jgi:hypothetical protein